MLHTWWRHQMETFSALLAICAGNSPVNSLHKGQWRGALMFSLICTWINGWVKNREAGGLGTHRPLWRHCNDPLSFWCWMVNTSLPCTVLSLKKWLVLIFQIYVSDIKNSGSIYIYISQRKNYKERIETTCMEYDSTKYVVQTNCFRLKAYERKNER